MNGERFLLGTHLLASIRASALQDQIASLIDYEYDIQHALSRLFFGT